MEAVEAGRIMGAFLLEEEQIQVEHLHFSFGKFRVPVASAVNPIICPLLCVREIRCFSFLLFTVNIARVSKLHTSAALHGNGLIWDGF